jgi:CO/xanthine dehydrogenase Mo-binding subunit
MNRNDLGPMAVDRRDFFKYMAGGVAVLVAFNGTAPVADWFQRQRGYPADFNAYVLVGEDGRVTVFSGKIEMGQGVLTSQAQMAAEELCVSLDSIDMVLGDTDRCPWDAGTWGSLTTRVFGPALRAACAKARETLLDLAAERLDVPADRLQVKDGVVSVMGGNGRVTYAELARGKKILKQLDREAVLHSVKRFAVMGTSPQRLDARDKVTGKAEYAGDIRLPGLLRARLLRPPVHGATLRSVDTSAAEKVPGVSVVNQEGLVVALHQDPEVAEHALRLMKPQFDVPSGPAFDDTNVWDHLIEIAPEARIVQQRGKLDAGAKASRKVFEHTYRDPYLAHSPMEPHTAVAAVEGDRITVWSSTQSPFGDQSRVAKALGIDEKRVRVITPYVGGGFGGKGSGGQALEAARLAWITKEPVQVMWTREEEFFFDTFHSAAVVRIRSGVDAAGHVQLWDYHVYQAGTRGAELFYDIPNATVASYSARGAQPFATGPWRAPGANSNAFARESQIDIMAADAKINPLEFRLRNTSDPRMRGVLQAVAKAARYKPAAGSSGRGIGVACGVDAGSYVAHVTEVEVDQDTGAVKVKREVCAQEMGIVVDPVGAKMQMEGCLTMGLGYALTEHVRFRGGDILDRNFDTYRIPRFTDVPEIETVLVPNDSLAPQGGGEPAIVCVGAAIANAIYDACGARVFEMPMTPAVVKAAMQAS